MEMKMQGFRPEDWPAGTWVDRYNYEQDQEIMSTNEERIAWVREKLGEPE